MITDKEAKNIAAKIRRGKDSHNDRVAYERWSKAGKGRRPRTPLSDLLADRRKREAAEDLLKTRTIPTQREMTEEFEERRERLRENAPGFDDSDITSMPRPKEPPIAPPLPPLDGEIVEDPIAPPIDLPEAPIPGFDLGGGIAKAARTALEAIDARNPEIGGISLARVFGADFWGAWEAATSRVIAKHVGSVQLADDEMMFGGAAVVVAQPIAIPYVKQHGAEWIDKIKRAVGFGAAS